MDSSQTPGQYILAREEPLSVIELGKTQNLLPQRIFLKMQNKDRFRHQLDISIYKKYKIVSTDMQKRLQVKKPVSDVLAIIDIDKDFYRYVNGRPLHLHLPLFTSLKKIVNKVLHVKQEVGFKRDCNLNIETNVRNEERVYDLAVNRLANQVKCFDHFISEDYQKSMTFLSECDELRSKVDKQALELQNIATDKFTLISKLISLEYRFGLQQKYGRFLYYLSPPSWRLNNRDFARSVEIEAKGFDFGSSSEEDSFVVLFEKMRKICYGVKIKPVLYFLQPKDLIEVFDAMETQQLHYYTHVNHFTPYAKLLKNGIRSLKEVIVQDSAVVENSIQRFLNCFKFYEQRCLQLETKFLKILEGLFYNSVASTDVIKLTLHLQFCYEKILLEKPINMNIKVMAKGLENFYMDYSKRLDSIKSDVVRRAMVKCLEVENRKVRKAYNAANELRLFYRLERELLRSHGFYTTKTYKAINENVKSLKQNKVLKIKTQNKKEIKNKSLTEEEVEYLTLFTEWTENDDPAHYLQSLKINKNADEVLDIL